jgi:alkylation response protein AidB-like acyl-CoA dehydrogenase
MSYDPPIADILDTLENVTGLGSLLDQANFADLDCSLARDILQSGADFVREHIAPHAAAMDTEGCAFDKGRVALPRAFSGIWQAYVDGGWLSLAIPRAHGGHGLPHLIQAAFSEMVCGASVPVSMLPLLVRGAAAVLARYGDDKIKAEYLPKLVDGRWAATISITEPGAGSDVALLKTKAGQQSNGSWRVNGAKMFISFGDHQLAEGILHMTLARIEGATGGLGLFAVPAFNDHRRDGSVTPQRIEHKLGLMASPTCVLQYDDAEGFPMGGPQDGLKTIFTMINLMRLEVAVQGVGLSSAATQAARSYADMRVQGSRGGNATPIARHPDIIRNLLTMSAVTDAARALVYETAKQLDLAENGRDPAVRERAARMAAFLLPVCKAGCAEAAVDVTDIAIQIHGGHGYIRDTGVERLYRDARILPIYEGTTGIQAIDLLLRKLNGGGFEDFLARVEADFVQADNTGSPSLSLAMRDAVDACEACVAHLRALIGTDRDCALAAATPFIRLVYRLALGWAWMQLVSRSTVDIDDRRLCAAFYAEQILPEVELLRRQIMASSAGWARGRAEAQPVTA